MNISNNTAYVTVPESFVFYDQPQVVNTVFVSIVDKNISLTPYNLSMINNHTVAGPTWLVLLSLSSTVTLWVSTTLC